MNNLILCLKYLGLNPKSGVDTQSVLNKVGVYIKQKKGRGGDGSGLFILISCKWCSASMSW